MTAARPSALAQGALVVLIALMLLGAGVGVYMTGHHDVQLYGGPSASFELVGCAEAEGVSCDIVNTSAWSEVIGVPTFTWAVPTYLLVAGLAVAALRGKREHLWSILGVGALTTLFSGWLAYVSVVELKYVCLWCMRLYGINVATPLLVLVAGALKAPKPGVPALGAMAAGFAALCVVAVGGERAYRASLLDGAPVVAELAPEGASSSSEADPAGPAPARTVTVTTEDDRSAELVIRPTDAWKGNPDAAVTIVEFADLECGYCKRASGQLRRIYETYGDRILVVFKHFPMNPTCNPSVKNNKHRDACNAAVASVCAQEQGKFWAYHDLAFKNQHELAAEELRAYAGKVGLDLAKYDACITDPAMRARVAENGQDGGAVDVHGTPRIFIQGKLYRSGSSAEQMAREIELALGASAADAASAARDFREERAAIEPIAVDVPEMVAVARGASFSIDTFEAGVVDGKAVSGKHVIPATRMSWFAARDACAAAGKRLCSEAEWVTACQGAAAVDDDGDQQHADDMIEGTTYPYGDFHEPGRCWDGKEGDGFRPVYTGEMPGCRSADGAYDLVGNVEEWVGSSPETAVLLGGAFDTSSDHARCYRRNDTFGAGYANARTGFRCCR